MPRLYLLTLGLLAAPAAWAQAPVLTARIPAANAPAASRTAPLQLTFDRPMSAQAATADAIRVFSPWRGRLAGSYAGAGTSTITFTPQQALLPGEALQVSVTPRATSLAGNSPAPSVYNFRAAAPTGPGRFPGFEHEDLVPGINTSSSPVLADINHDGRLDLLAAGYQRLNTTLEVRLGNAQGGFTAAPPVPLSFCNSLAVGDVNGDTHPDVLGANQGNGLVNVHLGNGQGGFTSGPDVAVQSPSEVVLGDVNNDGHLDLLTANSYQSVYFPSANAVLVRLGNGQGGFSGTTSVGVGGIPVALALGDVNGDGNLDFVTSDSQSRTVSVRLGNGQGSFTNGQTLSLGVGPGSVRLADVSGDGHLDLLVANASNASTGGTVLVRLGDGTGTFGAGTDVATGASPKALNLADVNRDGRLDLLVATNAGASVCLGNGQGGFGSAVSVAGFEAFPGTAGLAVGDLNADLYPDLLLTTNDQVARRLNNGQGSFSAPPVGPRIPVGQSSRYPTLADLNGDGKLDLLAVYIPGPTSANPNPAGLVSVRLGDGAGGFSGTTEVPVGVSPSGLTLGDINEDGHPDLLAPNYNLTTYNEGDGVTVTVRLGNGQGGFTNGADVAVGPGPKRVVLADVNGDGHLDVVVPNSYSTFNGPRNGTVSVRLGDGTGAFSGTTEVSVGTGTYRDPMQVAVADMNNDGKLDLLTANRLANSVSLRLGDGLGGFGGGAEIPVGQQPYGLATGDVNGDGNLDVLTANNNSTGYGSHAASVLLGNGQGGFTAAASIPNTGLASTIELADLNADGHLDALIGTRFESFGNLAGLNVSFGTGQGTFGPAVLLRAQDHFAVGDVDRDGDLDLLTTVSPTGFAAQLGLRLNGGGTGAVLATQAGLGPRPAAPLLSVYPNPARHEARVAGAAGREALQLLSSQGRLLRTLPAGTTALDLRALPAGLYLLRQGATTTRFVVE